MNRKVHRWLAGALGLPFLYICVTGTITTLSEMADPSSLSRSRPMPPAAAAPPPPIAPEVLATGVRTAVSHALRDLPRTPPGVIEVDLRRSPAGPRLQVWAEGMERTRVYDIQGHPLPDRATGQTARPAKLSTTLQDIHSGMIWGRPIQALVLAFGTALAVVTVTGVLVYLDMLRRRRAAARKEFFWD